MVALDGLIQFLSQVASSHILAEKRTTVKPVFFARPLLCEFRDLGDIVKTMGWKYAILVYYLVQQTKMPKLRLPKNDVIDRTAKIKGFTV